MCVYMCGRPSNIITQLTRKKIIWLHYLPRIYTHTHSDRLTHYPSLARVHTVLISIISNITPIVFVLNSCPEPFRSNSNKQYCEGQNNYVSTKLLHLPPVHKSSAPCSGDNWWVTFTNYTTSLTHHFGSALSTHSSTALCLYYLVTKRIRLRYSWSTRTEMARRPNQTALWLIWY